MKYKNIFSTVLQFLIAITINNILSINNAYGEWYKEGPWRIHTSTFDAMFSMCWFTFTVNNLKKLKDLLPVTLPKFDKLKK